MVICTTKDGRKIKLSEMGDNHLINRIKFMKRMLADRPSEFIYMGDSVYAEDAVEQENIHNEYLAEKITAHIKLLEKEAKKRKLEVK